jgi:hypothetical protein
MWPFQQLEVEYINSEALHCTVFSALLSRPPSQAPMFFSAYPFLHNYHHYRLMKFWDVSVISGFRRDGDEICALLGYYATPSGNPLPTFRDIALVPSSNVTKSRSLDPERWDRYVFPEKSVKVCHSMMCSLVDGLPTFQKILLPPLHTLKLEAAGSASEMSAPLYQNTRRHIS